jgi:hypothetical protein
MHNNSYFSLLEEATDDSPIQREHRTGNTGQFVNDCALQEETLREAEMTQDAHLSDSISYTLVGIA